MIPIYSPNIGKLEAKYLARCAETGWISSQGAFIQEFENGFASWNGMEHGVATSSCTTALHLALVAMGIGNGDEVLCPDLTFIAPANMIRWAGAIPVLIDIEEPSWAMNPALIEHKITDKTRAIIVVHPFGHAADMDPILEIANRRGLVVIEDVAEAPGAKYKRQVIGTFGAASCFSFFANKIMTTGEGGIVLSRSRDLDKTMRIYRDHGMSREERYVHVASGFNYRMTNMQAAIGVAQLERLDTVIKLRAKQEQRYMKMFNGNPRAVWRPKADWCETVHWMSTITLRNPELRTLLSQHLMKNGIETRQMVYPVHVAEPFSKANDPAEFPISRSVSMRSMHLPSSLDLDESDQQRIGDLVQEWLQCNDP